MQRSTIYLLQVIAACLTVSASSPWDHIHSPGAVEESVDEYASNSEAQDNAVADFIFAHSRRIRSTNPEEVRIRLVNGSTPLEGRLEVFYGGAWGMVCSLIKRKLSVLAAARVVCRQLGYYGTAEPLESRSFGLAQEQIATRLMRCGGDEISLAHCVHAGWGNTPRCSLSNDVCIRCSSNNGINGVRLVDGPSPSEGRLEVFHNNTWGTVCNTNASIELAIIVCRQLGYPTTVGVASPETFGPGEGQIWIDPVCSSRWNHTVGECLHDGWGSHDCDHSDDVGIICADFLPVRLVNGRRSSEGRIEVLHDGVWGGICNWDVDIQLGHVVCRQLGYPKGAASVHARAYFGRPETRMWLKPTCLGNESSLLHCSHQGWGSSCSVSNAAGVICIDDSIHHDASRIAACSTTNLVLISMLAVPLCVTAFYVMGVLACTFVASRRIKRKVKELFNNGVQFTSGCQHINEPDGTMKTNLEEYSTAPANLMIQDHDANGRDATPERDIEGIKPPFDSVTLASSGFDNSDERQLIEDEN